MCERERVFMCVCVRECVCGCVDVDLLMHDVDRISFSCCSFQWTQSFLVCLFFDKSVHY